MTDFKPASCQSENSYSIRSCHAGTLALLSITGRPYPSLVNLGINLQISSPNRWGYTLRSDHMKAGWHGLSKTGIENCLIGKRLYTPKHLHFTRNFDENDTSTKTVAECFWVRWYPCRMDDHSWKCSEPRSELRTVHEQLLKVFPCSTCHTKRCLSFQGVA